MSKNKTSDAQIKAIRKYLAEKSWRKTFSLQRAGNKELIEQIEALPRGEFSQITAKLFENYFNKNKE